MDVHELTKDQLNELKQDYVVKKAGCPSYGELADAVDIPDDVIFDHYAGYDFSNDDFFCTAGQ